MKAISPTGAVRKILKRSNDTVKSIKSMPGFASKYLSAVVEYDETQLSVTAVQRSTNLNE